MIKDEFKDQLSCQIEVFNLQEELLNMDDESLIDEVSDITMQASFCPVVDSDIESFFVHAKLDREERKRIEACYILFHGKLMIRPDGKIYAAIRQ